MAYTWSERMKFVYYYRTMLIVFITPLLILPLPLLIEGQEALAGYVLILMGVYWCTEALPLGVTALIPMFLVPMFGIMTVKEVTVSYMDDTTMLLVGGLIIALAVEKCNLHRRIAIKVLQIVGSSPRWLMLGFMIPTWFLSMWISNTATTAMMMPIVLEVASKLHSIKRMERMKARQRRSELYEGVDSEYATIENGTTDGESYHLNKIEQTKKYKSEGRTKTVSISGVSNEGFDDTENKRERQDTERSESRARSVTRSSIYSAGRQRSFTMIQEMEEDDKAFNQLAKALTLAVAYAANAGGTGAIIGTTVNLIIKGQADKIWQEHLGEESPINFTSWLVIGFPVSLINVIIIWLWLEIFYIGFREFCGCGEKQDEESKQAIKDIVDREYDSLGPIKTDEKLVMFFFIILVLLWFFRSPDFIEGWNVLFTDSDGKSYVTDSTPGLLIGVLMFTVRSYYPSEVPNFPSSGLVTWKEMKERFPWDVVLLLGGGIALAEATMVSGLSAWLGDQLTALENLGGLLLVYILGFLCTLLTQVTSNTASASLLLPIAASMAENIGMNPLYLMIPVAISVQYAFMLPVATPPNAIAYSTGHLTVMDMVKAGTMLNLLCVITMDFAVHTWIYAYFNLDTIPWEVSNSTMQNTTV